MMNWNTKYYWICIFLCIVSLSEASVSFQKADSLFKAQDYYAAQIEYERIVFSADTDSVKNEALLKKSCCYKQLYDHKSAIQTLQRIIFKNSEDSFFFQVKYETALNAFLDRSFELAEDALNSITNHSKDTILKQKIVFLYVLIYNEQLKWDLAHSYAKELIDISNFNQATKDSISCLLSEIYTHSPKIKDPYKARRLSSYIPGLGQIYSGYYPEGIFNFALNISTISLTIFAFYHSYLITGYLGGFSLFLKFYNGGLNRTEHLAKKYNNKHHHTYNNKLREIITSWEFQFE